MSLRVAFTTFSGVKGVSRSPCVPEGVGLSLVEGFSSERSRYNVSFRTPLEMTL